MSEETKGPEEATSGSDRASRMMSGMWKGLRDFGNVAREKAEEYGKIASDKAEELTKQGKLKLDIHQLHRSRGKTLTELGTLVFDLNHEGALTKLAKDEKFVAMIDRINALDVEISEKEAQAEKVEAEEGPEATEKVEPVKDPKKPEKE